MDGCEWCDQNSLRSTAEIYFENDHFIYASGQDPRDPPDVLPGSGIAIPITHRPSPFDFTPDEWAALGEVLPLAKAAWDDRLAPDGYFLSWTSFPGSEGAVAGMHAHLHIVPRFDDEPYADRGGSPCLRAGMMRMLTIAEQCIDRQEITDVLDGHEIKFVTGRVLLHALDSDERPLCGRDRDQLTAIPRSWSAGYLPHLPRCQHCVAAEPGNLDAGKHGPGHTGSAAPATGVDVRTAHGTDAESTAAAALAEVLASYDLRRWMFTDVVTVDESVRGAFSHPLTISPGRLIQRPAMALTTFIHEQLHWTDDGPGVQGATAEASRRWPDPPPLPAGCRDAPSTWLHMSICALEYQSLSEIIGQAAATAELAQHAGYSWVYEQILTDPPWFADYLRRHSLTVPWQPPVPRRYFGDAWWTLLGVN